MLLCCHVNRVYLPEGVSRLGDTLAIRPGPARTAVIIGRSIAVACTILVTAVVAELAVRTVMPVPEGQLLPLPYNADRVRQIATGDVYLGFDRDLGWTLTPDRVRRADGAVYRINSQSLRADREYDLQPTPDVTRVAAFGDSFTHCSEVTQDACWVAQLEQHWRSTEVLNFGVPGYGPDQAWLRYQRDGQQFQPCGVLIGYFIGDIERVVNRFRPFIQAGDAVVMSKPRYLLDGAGLTLLPNPTNDPMELADPTWVEATLGPNDAWYYPGVFVPQPFDGSMLVRMARTAAYQQARADLVRTGLEYKLYGRDQEAFRVTLRVLLGFADQVRANGAMPAIVVLPGRTDIEASQHGIRPHDRLVSRIHDAGEPVIDLTNALTTAARDRGIDALFADSHYSPLGNQIVAQELALALPELLAPTCELTAAPHG